MNKLKFSLYYILPAIVGGSAYFLMEAFRLNKILDISLFFIFFEALAYYLIIGLSKLYNPGVDFEKMPEYNRVVSAIIIAIHVMISVIMLGVYFAF